ncbi:MAG: hypothetical protein V1882_11035 [Candidatus Omnitrophota bacterium]
MTRKELLKGLFLQIQNLRERISVADEECPAGEDESELHRLEERLEMLTDGMCGRR